MVTRKSDFHPELYKKEGPYSAPATKHGRQTSKKSLEEMSAQLESDVEKFLANGGTIQKIAQGVTNYDYGTGPSKAIPRDEDNFLSSSEDTLTVSQV